ncbi:formylglycine-generating enzyme family protein [Leptothoe spongobia TAU-MAC 1115]|uniref:Formylglycine-generating enzyme family protein n=2 Tax=Leptothoe TaxID=2651725 RepID=A0A947DHR9_9CYAN|nr:formylglycine-generating enzyme family protein [Leptothoe spongobia TAU-MAC 1115]
MEPVVATRPEESPTEPEPEKLPSVTIEDAPPPPLPLPMTESEPKANLVSSATQAGVLPTETLPVWIADPAMLTDPLLVMRALKPLIRQMEVGTGRQLDEAATAEGIARTRLWLPVLAPDVEPWFDIILIIDRGSSMHIWRRLVEDVVRILRRYGAFRDLRVFDIEINAEAQYLEEQVLLKSHPERPGHRPSELLEQRGRRIAIVLSDCAGAYWWDGTLLPMLQTWARVMPTMVWQMLPEWMWERTALGRGISVALRNDIPGAANQQLMKRVMERDVPLEDVDHRVSIPVVTSEVRDLTNWSLMLAGDRREVTPGFLLPQSGGQIPKTRTIEEIACDRVEADASFSDDEALTAAVNEEILAIARDRVERFRQLASPSARRLVMLLAAAPVITLPVMRLIRGSMVHGESSPLPVAEVFLSGLLQRLPGQEQVEPDNVQYDFVPKVRGVLLEVLPPEETIGVVNSISAAVEKRWNLYSQGLEFRAFLLNPNEDAPAGLEGLRSFASVTAEILEPLGGEYAAFAQRLRQGSGIEPLQEDIQKEDDFTIPELRDIEFVHAELIDVSDQADAAPEITLIADEFNVATIVVEADNGEADADRSDFELFEFVSATLVRRQALDQSQEISSQVLRSNSEWVIQRQTRSAYRYIEILKRPSFFVRLAQRFGRQENADRLELEMVSVPGGTFTMGSPDTEPQRLKDEGPQHEVAVQPFLMGRYPVTQAQWRFVAGLEQINQSLAPDPSRFKGNNRPVERVSWYDAVEFCKRLSAHTGREYRLPTEAEWEYACRARTNTPFHFGETISTEVANYDGSAYAGGPKGKSRGSTTPVDEFGIANAFGLSDMHGNVFEWCQDHWYDRYEGAPADGSAWLNRSKGANRVIRGGSWLIYPGYCRSAYRYYDSPAHRDYSFGFRVVCSAPRILP